MAAAEPIVTELTIDGTGAERGQALYVRAMAAAQAQMERTLTVSGRVAESYNNQMRVSQQLAGANDNLSRSYQSANDNIRQSADSFKSSIVEVASMTNHLKLAALAAYAYSPAFRAMVNPAITASVAALGPAAVGAGTAIVRALSPALSFISQLSAPILAVVVAWEVLNKVISTGADLLEKYGNEQRNLIAGTDEKLKTLTRFQDDGVSAQQVQYATELGSRLLVAKKTISDFFEVQLNLTEPALKFQSIWVHIVEAIAFAVDKLNDFLNLLGRALPVITNIASSLPLVGPAILAGRGLNAVGGSGPAPSSADAMVAARKRLAGGLGAMAVGSDPNANIGDNFAVRFGGAIDALSGKAPKAAAEVAKVTSEFDRLEASMQRSAAVQEAESKAVDASVGEHARLRAEMRLQEAATQDIAKNGGQMEDYAERIKTLADRFGAAAQKAAELKLRSDIKFTGDTMFLSESDKRIASILRQIHGADWKNMMDGPDAAAIRFNDNLKNVLDTVKDIGSEITKGVVHALMDGKNVGEALGQTLKNLSAKLADKAIEQLLSGDFEKAAISALSAIATFIGSTLFGDGKAEAELKKNQEAWAGMADKLRDFNEAAKGFDLAPVVSQLRQLESTAKDLWMAAMKANDAKSAATVVQSWADSIVNTVKKFADPNVGASDAAKQIGDLNQNAAQLTAELLRINPAFASLSNEMKNGVAKQIEAIKAQVSAGISADINTAEGKGFINDLNNLIAETQQFRAEAGQTGADPVLIGRRFEVMAQKIVDGAGLVGPAFDDFVARVPELAGVLHAFTEAAVRSAQDVGAAQLSAQDRLFAAQNVSTTLEGQLAAQARQFERERLNEATAGGQAMTDLLSAQQAEELALRKSFNDKALAETQQAEQARLDALNTTARSVVDYINGLVSGPNSTLSPTTTLANAQAAYNSNLGLAQGGNIDAQNKFTTLADNLEKAARAVYASGQGYQSIRDQIVSQGLGLSSVQQTTDPVTKALADILLALTDPGKALILAVNAGNATNVAAALSNDALFKRIDTNTSGSIDFGEMKQALGYMASDTALRSMFTTLDADNSGGLTKLELIRAATNNVQDSLGINGSLPINVRNVKESTDTVATNAASTSGWSQSTALKVDSTNGRLDSTNGRLDSTNGTLSAIQGLQNTTTELLTTIRNQLTTSSISIGSGTGQQAPRTTVTSNDNLLTALEKIVYNTAWTAYNTSYIGSIQNPNHAAAFASGGVLGAGQFGIFGEHHPDGPWMMKAGSNPVPISPAMPSFSGANDNSAVVTEIRRLNDKIDRLEAVIAGSDAMTRRTIENNGDKVAGKVDDQTSTLAATQRQSDRQRKVA